VAATTTTVIIPQRAARPRVTAMRPVSHSAALRVKLVVGEDCGGDWHPDDSRVPVP
jgi:hypothetical protein